MTRNGRLPIPFNKPCLVGREIEYINQAVRGGWISGDGPFTFVSTANAFVSRGARPVFIDIRPDTLNLDESKLERLLSPRTRAIIPVHYAGVGCEMEAIGEIARWRKTLAEGWSASHSIQI